VIGQLVDSIGDSYQLFVYIKQIIDIGFRTMLRQMRDLMEGMG